MRDIQRELWRDEAGLILSVELILILTIGVLLLVVGIHSVAKAVNFEFGDLAAAIGTFDQSYFYDGFVNPDDPHELHSAAAGTGFDDAADDCDCAEIEEVRPIPKADGSSRNVPENL